MSALAPTLQAFFTDRLIRQRKASPHTIAAYRDTMRLLLSFATARLGKQPSKLEIDDLDAPLIGAFLEHLEHDRGNSVRTRNTRLAAIRSLFRYAAFRHPENAAVIERVLSIPPKRFERNLVTFLSEKELDAFLDAPDRGTWTGRRDHAMLLLAAQTGLRVSELTGLRCADLHLASGAHVSCLGKGRKRRITPLTTGTVAVLRAWLAERGVNATEPLFPTRARAGLALSRDAVERRLSKYTAKASSGCPSLSSKKVTPHVLRHTAAMRLLQAGVDPSVIALWLGHEQVETTQIYLHADLALKERALARTKPPEAKPGRYRPPDELLAFLEGL
jgi:site-specific recombinase XerD